VRQLLYFKQYGSLSGGSLVHPHMQVVTLPLMTPEMQNRLRRGWEFTQKFGGCAACRCYSQDILAMQGTAWSRLVYESPNFLVVTPFSAQQYRLTILPKAHGPSWLRIGREMVEELAMVLHFVMKGICRVLDDPEYNMYIFSVDRDEELESVGEESVHWVLEIHPRFPAELGGVEIASGIRVISGLPEDWAKRLREGLREMVEEEEAEAKAALPVCGECSDQEESPKAKGK